jgi:hypothetical protein
MRTTMATARWATARRATTTMMIATSEDNGDNDGIGATGDEVDDDGDGATGGQRDDQSRRRHTRAAVRGRRRR